MKTFIKHFLVISLVVSLLGFFFYRSTFLDENKLFDLVQNWRQSKGLSTYTKSEKLCGVADKRLEFVTKSFSHDGFTENTRASDWYGYNGVGENLVKGFVSEQESLNRWLSSPKHLENLEKPFTESCIRCSGSTCVQIFAGY